MRQVEEFEWIKWIGNDFVTDIIKVDQYLKCDVGHLKSFRKNELYKIQKIQSDGFGGKIKFHNIPSYFSLQTNNFINPSISDLRLKKFGNVLGVSTEKEKKRKILYYTKEERIVILSHLLFKKIENNKYNHSLSTYGVLITEIIKKNNKYELIVEDFDQLKNISVADSINLTLKNIIHLGKIK